MVLAGKIRSITVAAWKRFAFGTMMTSHLYRAP